MSLRQRLTICALLLTILHDDADSFPFCKGSHPNAAEPEDDVNFPTVGNRWIAHHENHVVDNNISNNTSQSIDTQAAVNQRQESQPLSNVISRDASQAAPTTNQHSSYWQQSYSNQHSANFAPTQFLPVPAGYRQYPHASSIFPSAQVLELSPHFHTPSGGSSDWTQRLMSTRRVVQPAQVSAPIAAVPLNRQWTVPTNAILKNSNSQSASGVVQQIPSSIRNTNSFTYLFD